MITLSLHINGTTRLSKQCRRKIVNLHSSVLVLFFFPRLRVDFLLLRPLCPSRKPLLVSYCFLIKKCSSFSPLSSIAYYFKSQIFLAWLLTETTLLHLAPQEERSADKYPESPRFSFNSNHLLVSHYNHIPSTLRFYYISQQIRTHKILQNHKEKTEQISQKITNKLIADFTYNLN